jgi:hypothetical protein
MPVEQRKSDTELDYDDDALMINEANEEIPDTNNNSIFNKTSKLEDIMNEKLLIENLDTKIDNFLSNNLVKCKLNLSENCFGHFESHNRLGI